MTNGTPQAAGGRQKKGLSPLAWVGIGCGILVLIVIVVLVAGSLFVAHKVKQAGFDPALWKKNPTLAASKMIAVLNPDLEVVKVDEAKGVITVRDKKSGKTVTLNLKDVERGKISIEAGEEGKTAKITIKGGEGGQGGTVSITDEKGTTVSESSASTAVKMPAWVPVYPGAEPGMHFTSERGSRRTGNFVFTTSATAGQVVDFYTNMLKANGFKVEKSLATSASRQVGTVTAVQEGGQRSVNVLVTHKEGETKLTVSYSEKSGR